MKVCGISISSVVRRNPSGNGFALPLHQGWLICICLLFAVCHAKAQEEAVLSGRTLLPAYYNAGATGREDGFSATAFYRQQWIGMPGAPAYFGLSASAPVSFLGRKHGAGVLFSGSKRGLFTSTSFCGQYAFRIKIGKGFMGIGAEAGLFNVAFDGTKIQIPDGDGLQPNDPGLPLRRVSGRAFDAGAGIYYEQRSFFVGMACKHLLSPKVSFEQKYYHRLRRAYSLTAGYNIYPKGTLFSWHPSVMALTDLQSYSVDLCVEMMYNERWIAAVAYRPAESAGFAVGFRWDQLRFRYGFTMPISALARQTWGSHEVTVSYLLPLKNAPEKGLRRTSARLL